MSDNPFDPSKEPTSARKAESNRRNARKSTGPKTARGKSCSRLNALKHGILASQAVIAATEGHEERKAFEQLVDGLGADFAPVGTFEQMLVQQIAACFWRQRRLLRFENRAAFQALDNRTFRELNEPQRGFQPLYEMGEVHLHGGEILDAAGLGFDLPGERDTMRLVRYEASITRSLRNAMAQLKTHQQARRAGSVEPAKLAPAYEDRAVVVDAAAARSNRGPAVGRLSVNAARTWHRRRMERQAEEEAELRAEEAAERAASGAAPPESSENHQTKPNLPEDPEALLQHQRLLESADAMMKLSARLAPKRRPGTD
jgi:hypothetical protein